MASKTSSTEQPVIRMAEVGERVSALRAKLGVGEFPRNAGARRTASKRSLLKAIEDAGGKW